MLILVRHGRTALNAAGRLQGRVDEPVDAVGAREAVAVATAIGALGAVDEVIASPLRRAQQTAEAFGVPFSTDDRWIELAYGVFDGVQPHEVPPDAWDSWRGDTSWSPPGGESLAALDARVRGACDELRDRAAERNVVVVTHVSPIKAAVAWSLGVGVEIAWRSHLSHASMSRIEMRRTGPVLLTFNETVPVP